MSGELSRNGGARRVNRLRPAQRDDLQPDAGGFDRQQIVEHERLRKLRKLVDEHREVHALLLAGHGAPCYPCVRFHSLSGATTLGCGEAGQCLPFAGPPELRANLDRSLWRAVEADFRGDFL